jgi:hypothetical protein
MNPGSFHSDSTDCWVGSYHEDQPRTVGRVGGHGPPKWGGGVLSGGWGFAAPTNE